jgi:hypothetical protein
MLPIPFPNIPNELIFPPYVGASREDALLEFWTGADAETTPCLSPGL